jgi:hypothetical protein
VTIRRVAAFIVVAFLSVGALGAARPGGGETYSRETRAESRDDTDNSSGGGAAALLVLIELCVRYPKAVVPLLLAVGGLLAYSALSHSDGDWESVSREVHADTVPDRPARPSLDLIKTVDPDFSSILLEDFVFRLYATAHSCRGANDKLGELAPYVSAAARRALAERPPAGQPIIGIVIGKMSVYRVSVPAPEERSGDFAAIVKVGVQFEANYSVGSGPGDRRFVVEDWLLRRAADARTKPPDAARRFPCPNCGAPWRSEQAAGTQKCAFCGAVVDNGRFDWQVEEITVRRETDNVPGLEADVPERGTSLPTIVHGQFAEEWNRFVQQDPGVSDVSIAARLGYVYKTINVAWSRGELQTARPVLSDGLADYFQYWLDAYQTRGLRNVLDDMCLTQHELVKLARDRYYDALTIRIWATGKDYVVRTADGTIVRGSRDSARAYSEYWTLIRSSSRSGAPRLDPACGSCGATLTVTMSGQCEHCGSHVTAGEFDWVLSKIEQDEAYQG